MSVQVKKFLKRSIEVRKRTHILGKVVPVPALASLLLVPVFLMGVGNQEKKTETGAVQQDSVWPKGKYERTSNHSVVEFSKVNDGVYANEVASLVDKLWNVYMKKGRPLPKETIRIVICPTTQDFTSATARPSFVAGATRGTTIFLQPMRILTVQSTLESTLSHEFAHVSINSLGESDAPLWLKEGFAVYLSGHGELVRPKRTRQFEDGEELDLLIELPGSKDDLTSAYWFAFQKVHKLIRQFGEKYIWEALRTGEIDF